MFGPTLYQAFRTVKRTFDPNGLFNPGRIVDTPPITAHLRFGSGYETPDPPTHFDYAPFGGFGRAVEMCSGVGACRKTREGTMCPSYMATKDEAHSTRGRANVLRLALNGRMDEAGLDAEAVKGVLDLCLECRACKSECPDQRGRRPLQERIPRRLLGRARHLVAGARVWLRGRDRGLGQPFRAGGESRRDQPPGPPAGGSDHRAGSQADATPLGRPDAARTSGGSRQPRHGRHAGPLCRHLHVPRRAGDRRGGLRHPASLGAGRDARPARLLRPSPDLAGAAGGGAATRRPQRRRALSARRGVGAPIVFVEPSCLSAVREDAPDLLRGSLRDRARVVASRAVLFEEYLEAEIAAGRASLPLRAGPRRILLHVHCHQRSMGLGPAGFVYVWIGAMIGASAAFVIGRTLGREFAASLVGDRLRKYDDAIERNGFATVLYLRLIYFPFTPMNFGLGLTKVHFRDYLFGTGLGILVGTFIFTFLIGTLKEVWVSGHWAELLSFKVIFSVALFVLSFFIPKAIRLLRGEGPAGGAPARTE